MPKTLLLLAYLSCWIITACQPTPDTSNINGIWELFDSRKDIKNIVWIKDDSISIPNYWGVQKKLSVSLQWTDSTLNLPNPCVEEHYPYQFLQDTFYLDSTILLYRCDHVTSEALLYNTNLDIQLETLPKNATTTTISQEDYALYIGPQRDTNSYRFHSYFSEDCCLRISDFFCDSLMVETWLSAVPIQEGQPSTIVLYKDKRLEQEEYAVFLRKISTTLGEHALLFEAYFDKQAPTFLQLVAIDSL
ncbi:MAG: hypothetical protein ACRBFS_16505 [Aureispira sp.]